MIANTEQTNISQKNFFPKRIIFKEKLILLLFPLLFSIKTTAQTTSFSCVGNLSVALDEFCLAEITPKRLLQRADTIKDLNNFRVQLTYGLTNYPSNYLTNKDIYHVVRAELRHTVTNRVCYSNVFTQDTTPPKIDSPRDIVIQCSQADTNGIPSKQVTGEPRVVSDCSKGFIMNHTDETFYAACIFPFTEKPDYYPADANFDKVNAEGCSRIIVRTFWVADTFWNATKCKQVIYIKDANFNNIRYPLGKELYCTGSFINTEPDSTVVNGKKLEGTGRPMYSSGDSLKGNFCQIRATYRDTRINYPNYYLIYRDWTLFNPCKNIKDFLTQNIYVYDSIPKISCKPTTIVNLTESKTLTVFAETLVASVSDQCTPKERLQIGIRKVGDGVGFPVTSSLQFGCGDTVEHKVELWVKDESNSTATCITSIQVTDTEHYCLSPLSIEGKLARENAVSIKGNIVLADLKGVPIAIKALSDSFKFVGIRPQKAYKLTVQRPKDWLNGVSTFDIALISKHILGIQYLDSPYKLLAADVNGDGEISAADMLYVRKLILRQIDSIPEGLPWRFIPKNYNFINPHQASILDVPEYRIFNPLTDTIKNADFTAIKTGDVNASARENALISLETRGEQKPLFFTLTQSEKGEIIVSSETEQIQGFQMTLNFDKKWGEIITLETLNLEGFSANNYVFFKEKGQITVSWNGKTQKGDLFKIKLKSLENTPLANFIQITSDLTTAEAYTPYGEIRAIKQQINAPNTTIIEGVKFHLFQNNPNPFDNATSIRFTLPETDEVQFRVYDSAGRTVKMLKQVFQKGMNEINLSVASLPSGVLFYQVKTTKNTAAKKMVVLK